MNINSKNELFTATGKLLQDAIKDLDRLFPVEAYKPMKRTGSNSDDVVLTNINPAFSFELIAELFGSLGIGWGYEELEFHRDGQYCATKIKCWYRLYDGAGNPLHIVEWTSRGGSTNSGNREWAEKGALTNALSAGWSLQGLQASVYKGVRNHDNVAKEWRKLNGTAGGDEAAAGDQQEKLADVTASAGSEQTGSVDVSQAQESLQFLNDMADGLVAKLKEAGIVKISVSKDRETVYAVSESLAGGKGANPEHLRAIKNIGGIWDKTLSADVHKLPGKKTSGSFVFAVPRAVPE